MGKLFIFLIIAFAIIFVVQQSHLIEEKKVLDKRLGVATEQYRLNWDNFFDYFKDLSGNIKKMIPAKKQKRRYRESF